MFKPDGIYACCEYDSESLKPLVGWMMESGIPSPIHPKDIHTTILYSRTPIKEIPPISFSNWSFEPKGFEVFEDRETNSNVLVITLDAPELCELHENLINVGGSHDFPSYIPHITISYSLNKEFDVSSLYLPKIQIKPSMVYFKPLNLNWKYEELKSFTNE